jgi:hypothetical protein
MSMKTMLWLTLVVLGLLLTAGWQNAATAAGTPPRFTEEREAAARFFVKKHLPELLPLLDELKKNNASQYEQQIREIFQVTEMLADLMDEPRLYELELKIWVAENRAYTLVARLATPSEEERRKLEAQLQELARGLVELDIQFLEIKADMLDRELGEVKDELTKLRENTDKQIRERYEGLVDHAKKRKKAP